DFLGRTDGPIPETIILDGIDIECLDMHEPEKHDLPVGLFQLAFRIGMGLLLELVLFANILSLAAEFRDSGYPDFSHTCRVEGQQTFFYLKQAFPDRVMGKLLIENIIQLLFADEYPVFVLQVPELHSPAGETVKEFMQ